MIKKKKSKIYYTHDNGAKPFKIILKGDNAEIYKVLDDGNMKLILEISFISYFIGLKGSSILLHLKSDKKDYDKYLFIGHEIFSFYVKDKIEKYYSPIGNNDVPYPYAMSKNNIYLMLDYVILDRTKILTKDPYNHYYFMDKDATGLKIRNFRKRILAKRNGTL